MRRRYMRQTDVETRVCASERTPLVRPCARAASPASGHACIRRARVRDRWQREGRFEHDLTQLDIQYSSQNDTQRTDASTRVSSHARARAFKPGLPSCAWHDPPSTSLAYPHTPRRERGTRQPPQCPPRSSYAGVRARARAIDGDSVDVSASLRSRNDRACTRKLRRGRALSRERQARGEQSTLASARTSVSDAAPRRTPLRSPAARTHWQPRAAQCSRERACGRTAGEAGPACARHVHRQQGRQQVPRARCKCSRRCEPPRRPQLQQRAARARSPRPRQRRQRVRPPAEHELEPPPCALPTRRASYSGRQSPRGWAKRRARLQRSSRRCAIARPRHWARCPQFWRRPRETRPSLARATHESASSRQNCAGRDRAHSRSRAHRRLLRRGQRPTASRACAARSLRTMPAHRREPHPPVCLHTTHPLPLGRA